MGCVRGSEKQPQIKALKSPFISRLCAAFQPNNFTHAAEPSQCFYLKSVISCYGSRSQEDSLYRRISTYALQPTVSLSLVPLCPAPIYPFADTQRRADAPRVFPLVDDSTILQLNDLHLEPPKRTYVLSRFWDMSAVTLHITSD